MNVYKYRSGGNYLKRDLKSISQNYFYASNAENLNDPCETLVFSDKIKNQTKLWELIGGKKTKDSLIKFHADLDNLISIKCDLGIYSLSKSYNDELLWAHYANNHKGFCIEYDFDILMDKNSFYDFYSFDVDYSLYPPQIEIKDISSDNPKPTFKKIAGTKSKNWSYEQEVRIITDKYGEYEYHYSAVKAIYFGLRMPEDQRDEIMKQLAGRGLKYYQINLDKKSYSFYRELIPDKFENSQKYLFEFYGDKNKTTLYSITKLEYKKAFKKGHLSILLDSKIDIEELRRLGYELKNKLFRSAEQVYIFYYLKNDLMLKYPWGITHFVKSKETVEINGLTSEEETIFKDQINGDKRLVIGHWLDEFDLKSLLTIYEDNGKVFMEMLFRNKSILTTEQVVSKVNGNIKYQDIDDIHGEYLTIDKNGLLYFYSENGVYNKVEKITYNAPSLK